MKLRIIVAISVLTALANSGCGRSDTEVPGPEVSGPGESPFQFAQREPSPSQTLTPQESSVPWFVDRNVSSFPTYENGEQGKSLMVETMGGGVGWLDYDMDGIADLYFTQGGDPSSPASTKQPNDNLLRGFENGRFENVSVQAQIREFNYSQGVAIGDYDNDGFDDVYVTNTGANTFWQNQGDGTFRNVTLQARVGDPRWSSSAAWADIDLDGDLDLYVCNYLKYDPRNPIDCRTKQGEYRICHPKDIDPWPDACYVNLGDGRFVDQAAQRNLVGSGSKALGVAIGDFNNDYLPDVYVANDTTANFLFVNQGKGQFIEQARLLGCAVDRRGSYQASMGIGVADLDANGFLDLYVTHFESESNTLYRNFGPSGFRDSTATDGLHAPTVPYLAFGVAIADFDLDGLPNMFVCNGHIENYPDNPNHRMDAQILNFDGQRWRQSQGDSGDYFRTKRVARGVAVGDYNRDGLTDLVVVHQNLPASLLESTHRSGNWLSIKPVGLVNNRSGIGTRVVLRVGERHWMQELVGGSSYASSHEKTLYFGLGDCKRIDAMEIWWPGGKTQHFKNVVVNQSLVVREP